jgi:Immunity protein 8
MTRADLREISSLDVDLGTFTPDDATDVGIVVRMLVGPSDAPGEETFDVLVCTARWLSRHVHQHGPLIGRHHLVVEEFDSSRVQEFLKQAVEACSGETWSEVGEKVGRLGHWEFEDYQSW